MILHGDDLVNLPDETKERMLKAASEARRGYWSKLAKQCAHIDQAAQQAEAGERAEPEKGFDEGDRAAIRGMMSRFKL